MAVYEMKQKGNNPIWEFKCPLCGEEWSEYWLEGSDLHVHEVDVLRTKKLGEKTFQAGMNCRCCGLLVWSDKIDKKDGNEDERLSDILKTTQTG